MNPSSLAKIVLTVSAAGLALASTDKVLDSDQRVLRGFSDPKEEKGSNGMILIAGPVATQPQSQLQSEPEVARHSNPFLALFMNRHRRQLTHHRRHRIHRRPYHLHGLFATPLFSRPKAFLEVMKVRERVVVDEQNRPKSAEFSLTNDLMQVDPISGRAKLLRHGELLIKPKKSLNSSIPNSSDSNNLINNNNSINNINNDTNTNNSLNDSIFNQFNLKDAANNNNSRLDRFIRFLHLDQFWPLFFFSAICGFSFVGLTFLVAKTILGFIEDPERDSYETVPTDEKLLNSIEAAQPIKITNEMIEVSEKTSLNSDQ